MSEGDSPGEIQDALEAALTTDLTEDIRTRFAKVLERNIRFPYTYGDRTINGVATRSGDPMHGEKRSDDHISFWSVTGMTNPPLDCGHRHATYKYRAYHHISGSVLLTCEECDHTQIDESW